MVGKLAWRYFCSRRNHPFIPIIRRISVLGVATGVTALIVVLSVMHGFEVDLKQRIVGTYAHAIIEMGSDFDVSDELRKKLTTEAQGVEAFSPFVYGQVLMGKEKNIQGVLIKGANFETERKVSAVESYILQGEYPKEQSMEVMMGDALAGQFNLVLGDKVSIISPATRKPTEAVVSAIFHSGMYEYDAHLVYTSLSFAQELYRVGQRVTGIGVRYHDAEMAIKSKKWLQRELGFPYYVRTWMDMNRSLFGALKLERTVMFIILVLIVMVACFNIVGTLTLLVIDKTRDIGILKSLGASRLHVMGIFTLNGLFIGTTGTLLGLGAGVGLCALLKRYPIIDIPEDIYYFSRLPVQIYWSDVVVILVSALALTLLSTLYPAKAAADLKAVEAMRYQG